jgi:hypothetical protein
MIEEEPRPVPSKGWAALAPKRRIGLRSAEMIRKVCEVDPLVCPNSEASYRTAKRCPKCGSLAVLMASMSAAE